MTKKFTNNYESPELHVVICGWTSLQELTPLYSLIDGLINHALIELKVFSINISKQKPSTMTLRLLI